MYGNFKIKYQEELEKLPYFNKKTAAILLEKEDKNLDRKIERLIKSTYFLRLKNGLYVTQPYLLTVGNREKYGEALVPVLCFPSYLSSEYILSREGLIPEAIQVYTGVTIKSTRGLENFLGRFYYQNIDAKLFCGFTDGKASKAKALFDYLYLKSNLGTNLQKELSEGLRINWDNFSPADFEEFSKYVVISGSQKMKKIAKIMTEILK